MLLGFALAQSGAAAEEYPSKPIRFIVPHAAGSAVDTVARQIGPRLAEKLGQQVIVDNRPGAGGIMGTDAAAKSPADGYTIMLAATQQVVNVSLYKSLPYDTLKDFVPVARVTSQPLLLAVSTSVPANTVPELLEYIKKKPGASYASIGPGSSLHLAGAFLAQEGQVKLNHIPYNVAIQAVADVARGDVLMIFYPYPLLKGQIESGKLKVLAHTGDQRLAYMPNLPTMVELGFKDFVLPAWHAFYAPAGTPRDRIDILYRNIAEILKNPEAAEKIEKIGIDIYLASPDEMAKIIPQEVEKYRKIIETAGIEKQ
ncbi:MAG: tripartite tricarboxylate transporter substrate binding protein [Bradyrhizobiaceae bacterium]|nr:tripartite tricarboxylate transporter substrate binding protein [Bradyrhizobiaceae bacterium]